MDMRTRRECLGDRRAGLSVNGLAELIGSTEEMRCSGEESACCGLTCCGWFHAEPIDFS